MEASVKSQQARSALQVVILIAVWAWAQTIVIYVAVLARDLRPIADDYSLGAGCIEGIAGATIHRWMNWSGDITGVLVNNALVGWPVAHLPWTLASAVPFLAAAAAVSGFMTYLCVVWGSGIAPRKRIGLVFALAPLLAVAWWGYWWAAPGMRGSDPKLDSLRLGVTLWQNINSAYVVVPVCLAWLWAVIEARDRWRYPMLRLSAYAGWGLAAGMAGPVFAGSCCAMLTLYVGAFTLEGRSVPRSRLVAHAGTLIAIVIGAMAALSSPGAKERARHLVKPPMDLELLGKVLHTVPDVVVTWWSMIFSPSSAIVACLVAGFTILLGSLVHRISKTRLMRTAVLFLAMALVLLMVNRASEFFAYVAWWHEVTARTFAFLGVCAAAAATGASLSAGPKARVALPLAAAVCLLSLACVTASTVEVSRIVRARLVQWNAGPAPALGKAGPIADINVDWVLAAWRRLAKSRDAPVRGTEGPVVPLINAR